MFKIWPGDSDMGLVFVNCVHAIFLSSFGARSVTSEPDFHEHSTPTVLALRIQDLGSSAWHAGC